MSWKRHVDLVPTNQRLQKALRLQQTNTQYDDGLAAASGKYASYLAEYYDGHPQRIQRYQQYHEMDQDPIVNSALDTIADFCTQIEERNDELFQIIFNEDASDTEQEILKTSLKQWTKINEFKRRIWRTFRNTIKYGDQFFIRDPETLKWIGINADQVEHVVVNPTEGKNPEYYIIKDLDLHLQSLTAAQPDEYGNDIQGAGAPQLRRNAANTGRGALSKQNQQNSFAVKASHVIHLSLSEGLDANWPFGTSVLESVFKVYRQKELLSDAIIIYRIVRAPERRVFYVDVGNMPPHKAQAYLERMKNEMAQRRFPTRQGGSGNIVDAAYNPMSMMEDFFFAQTAEGRGSKVDTLPAGENLGQIDDLRFWTNMLIRGLQVPSSYLPSGPDDGNAVYNDGRVGTAYLQEYRFARYCQRLQMLVTHIFDNEFKLFLKQRGLRIGADLFELRFNPPMDFRQFAQIERDAAQIAVFTPLVDVKFIARRTLLIRYLGWSEDEVLENERWWKLENAKALGSKAQMGDSEVGSAPGLEAVGVRPEGDDMGMDDDMGDMEEMPDMDDSGDTGGDGGDLGGDIGGADTGGGEGQL